MALLEPTPPPPSCPECDEVMVSGIFLLPGGETILDCFLCRGCRMVWEQCKDAQA